MNYNTFDKDFWIAVDKLVAESEVVIDRHRGSCHPRHSFIIYPVDYGYLKDTSSMDGGGIDVWRGTNPDGVVDAIICTVDLLKKDSEIKLLIGCTDQEKETVYLFHNENEHMRGVLIERK